MINGILQFIKRLLFARRLARFDLLFLLANFSCFRKEVFFAKSMMQKSSLPISERLYRFLEAENNDFLYALAEEISVRLDLTGGFLYNPPIKEKKINKGETVFRETNNLKNIGFYYNLLYRAAKEKEQLYSVLEAVKKRLDSLLDMRFYGGLLETLSEQTSAEKIFSPNWILITKNKLYLDFIDSCRRTDKLTLAQQQNLAALFGDLLFNRSLYVSFWNGIIVDSQNNVAFASFDGIFEANSALKKFISQQRLPQTDDEFRLYRAVLLLKAYCPDVDVIKSWSSYFRERFLNADLSAAWQQLNSGLKKHNVVVSFSSEPKFTEAKNLSYLLDVSRHRKDPQFRKSTVYYWGPLLITIYLLFKYF